MLTQPLDHKIETHPLVRLLDKDTELINIPSTLVMRIFVIFYMFILRLDHRC